MSPFHSAYLLIPLIACINCIPVAQDSAEDSAEYRGLVSRNCNTTAHPCPCLLDNFGQEIAYACSPRSDADALAMKEAFEGQEAKVHDRIELKVTDGVKIPADFLGQHQARELVLSADEMAHSVDIDANAFRASADTLQGVEFQSLNMDRMNFDFLKHFTRLERVEFTQSRISRQLQLPELPALNAVEMFDTHVEDWPIPLSSAPKLKSVELFSIPGADDEKIGRLLDSIPQQVSSFTCSECGLTQLPVKIRQLHVEGADARANALEGELHVKELDLSDNKLKRLEASAFRDVLESMARSDGFIDIADNPISCDCHLRWLIRDQRKLLATIRNGQCADGKAFEDLDSKQFEQCG